MKLSTANMKAWEVLCRFREMLHQASPILSLSNHDSRNLQGELSFIFCELRFHLYCQLLFNNYQQDLSHGGLASLAKISDRQTTNTVPINTYAQWPILSNNKIAINVSSCGHIINHGHHVCHAFWMRNIECDLPLADKPKSS